MSRPDTSVIIAAFLCGLFVDVYGSLAFSYLMSRWQARKPVTQFDYYDHCADCSLVPK